VSIRPGSQPDEKVMLCIVVLATRARVHEVANLRALVSWPIGGPGACLAVGASQHGNGSRQLASRFFFLELDSSSSSSSATMISVALRVLFLMLGPDAVSSSAPMTSVALRVLILDIKSIAFSSSAPMNRSMLSLTAG
jgi:hypothetical protein